MKRILWAFLAWTLLLCACSTRLASPQLPPPPIIDRPSALPPTAVPSSKDEISTVAPNPQDCGYQWANQDLSELSRSFQASIQALQPEAQANAYAFGENCVLADGNVRSFGAMETDFKVTLQVTDLTNESNLGEWIVKVMQVIENIPKAQIVGPQPGRVSIGFISSDAQKSVNFYINQYQGLPAGLSNSEIYQALLIPQ